MIGTIGTPTIPCVECPESPDIEISAPIVHGSAEWESASLYGNYRDTGPVRDVVVKRRFYCLKKDINTVTSWLTSLSGVSASLAYNAGADGEKTIAGRFSLNGRVLFRSFSPTIAIAEANFIGIVLDCNYILAPGLSFVKETDKKYQIKIDSSIVEKLESVSDGDGSGISFDVGEMVSWFNLPDDIKKSMPKTVPELPANWKDLVLGQYRYPPANANFVAAGLTELYFQRGAYYMLCWYKKIVQKINGETAATWYVRMPTCRDISEVSYAIKPLYYAVTQAERDAEIAGTHPFNSEINVADTANSRFFTSLSSKGQNYFIGNIECRKCERTPPIVPCEMAYNILQDGFAANGYYTPMQFKAIPPDYDAGVSVEHPENVYRDDKRYYFQIGFVAELTGYDRVGHYSIGSDGRGIYYTGGANYESASARLDINWESDSIGVRLVATDSMKARTTLIEWTR